MHVLVAGGKDVKIRIFENRDEPAVIALWNGAGWHARIKMARLGFPN